MGIVFTTVVIDLIGFGIVGYMLKKADFPTAPLILALILCPRLERSIQQSLIGSGGDPSTFIESPIFRNLSLSPIGMPRASFCPVCGR